MFSTEEVTDKYGMMKIRVKEIYFVKAGSEVWHLGECPLSEMN